MAENDHCISKGEGPGGTEGTAEYDRKSEVSRRFLFRYLVRYECYPRLMAAEIVELVFGQHLSLHQAEVRCRERLRTGY